MNNLIKVLSVLLLSACAQPEADPAPFTEEDGCHYVVTPAVELADYAQQAVARWSTATGCDIRVGPGGSPITLHPQVYAFMDTDNVMRMTLNDKTPNIQHQVCAGASPSWGGYIWIAENPNVSCPDDLTVMTHEVGHLLSGGKDHTLTGLMRTTPSSGEKINDDSLSSICSDLDCQVFVTEL